MAEKQSKEMQVKESEKTEAKESKDLLVKVTRESFGEKDDIKLYSYHINAIIRGKEKKISLMPKDNGGYELLNIIFFDEDTVDGKIVFNDIKLESGETLNQILVEVFVIDDGITYAYQLKTQRDSDKATLKILAEILKLKASSK